MTKKGGAGLSTNHYRWEPHKSHKICKLRKLRKSHKPYECNSPLIFCNPANVTMLRSVLRKQGLAVRHPHSSATANCHGKTNAFDFSQQASKMTATRTPCSAPPFGGSCSCSFAACCSHHFRRSGDNSGNSSGDSDSSYGISDNAGTSQVSRVTCSSPPRMALHLGTISGSCAMTVMPTMSSMPTMPTIGIHSHPFGIRSQQLRNKVFVSKHNNLNITSQNIIDYCEMHGIHKGEMRITNTHVIIKECPFCNASDRPTRGKASNLYKLYVQIGGGAYFCHRCAHSGSWYDFKLNLGGSHQVESGNINPAGRQGSSQGLQWQPSPGTSQGRNQYAGAGMNISANAPKNESVRCLPMPEPRLAALYSSLLLDMDGADNGGKPNKVLDYLINERGLTRQTLRTYGVGSATYKFPTDSGYESADCVTFPWMLKVGDVKIQEELRGAKFIHSNRNAQVESGTTAASVPASASSPLSTDDSKTTETAAAITARSETTGEENKDASIRKNDSEETTDSDTSKTADTKPDPDDFFITRRIKVRAVEQKGWQRLDPSGGGWGLFGFHTVPDDCKEVIVTEGEYDAMAVRQATDRPAVSLPNGCRSLPVEVLPLLERFEKVYLWMDNDAPGLEGAEKFAKKIGLGRAYVVRCEEAKDANDALRMGLDLNKYIEEAEHIQHDKILTFKNLRKDVLHEIMNPNEYSGIPVKSLPMLTNTIKGFRKGELTVFTGPTGSGKTTLLGQLSIDLAEQGTNCLWGSFEIKNTRLIHKLMQQFGRAPLPVAGTDDVEVRLNALADRFENLPLFFMRFHGGSDIDEVIDAMEYAVYVDDVSLIILDNMQFMISRNVSTRSSFDKFDVQDLAIEKFRKFATEHNVHLVLVVHPRKEDETTKLGISSIYGSAKATQEADTVMILQFDGRRKYIDIKKNRFDGTTGVTPLFFDRKTGRYSEDERMLDDDEGEPFTMRPGGGGGKRQPRRPPPPPPPSPPPEGSGVWDRCLSPGDLELQTWDGK